MKDKNVKTGRKSQKSQIAKVAKTFQETGAQ
jgi:hypothetical protein